ncbi:MAG: phenylalanine--tRNA ligase subunit alpha [Deltaproteobacteria bacterium]|nr:phenylalanine--tRNA ligase subunit alpha [Deltaproteobacteria bacterium]
MFQSIERVRESALAELLGAASLTETEALRIKYLGRQGTVTELLKGLKDVDPATRPEVGKRVNALKGVLEVRLAEVTAKFRASEQAQAISRERVDAALPGRRIPRGHPHPIRMVMDEVIDCFAALGFSVFEGPEIETDYYNFEALNVPADHPARDMQDTFYTTDGRLLRTHTSPVQIHVMERLQPPVAMIAPGAVYRRDSFDASHSPMFHQVEGLMVDRGITFAHMKGILSLFWKKLFGEQCRVLLRPSYFPFTEPSAEVAIGCVVCRGKGCRICKQSGWLEVMGCGMVHPNVFRAVRYDDKVFSGFAFGMGIERIAMLKFGIQDIRLFFENDVRFLEQFR